VGNIRGAVAEAWYAIADLHDQTLLLLLSLGQESSTSGRFEDLANTIVSFGGAFEVLVGANLLANLLSLRLGSASGGYLDLDGDPRSPYLFWCHRLLRRLCQLFDGLVVVAKIALASHKDDR
jgi:hypothetical protein